jgi:nucleoside-diphosphate-sugar epimerase
MVDKCLQGLGMYQTEIHVAGEMNKDIACSIEKARRELGYNPKIDLKEGMKRSLDWCRKVGLF